MKVKFIRFNEHIRMPERKHYMDTGLDIYMPFSGLIAPHITEVIPLGFGIEIPNGYTGRMQVRTSIAKEGIIIQGCAIDAGYNGELHMILHNVSDKIFRWQRDDRLGYIEIYPTQYIELVDDDIKMRGKNGFGSTGR